MAVEQTAVINIDTGESRKSIKDLQRDIKGYKDDLVSLDKNSVEYQQTLEKLTQANQTLSEVNNTVRNSTGNLSDVFNNATSVASSLTSGFAAAQGAAALFGADSENLEKALLKVQSAMALTSGLKGLAGFGTSLKGMITSVKSARTAFAAFTKTLLANPFIAIATAVLALGTAIAGLVKILGSNKKDMAALNAEYEKHQSLQKQNQKDLDLEIRLMKAQGATEEEIIAKKQEATRANIAATQALIAEYEARKKLDKAQKENLKNLREELDGLLEYQNSLNNDSTVLEEQRRQERIKADKSEAEARIKQAEEYAKQLKAVREKELEDIKEIQTQISDYYKTEYEKRTSDLTTEYNRELALLQKYGQDTTQLTEKYQAEMEALAVDNQKKINDATYAGRQKYLADLRNANDEAVTEQEIYLERISTQLQQAELNLRNAKDSGDQDSISAAAQKVAELQELIITAQNETEQMQTEYLEIYRDSIAEILETQTLNDEARIELQRELQSTLNQIELNGLQKTQNAINKEIAAKDAQAKAEQKILADRQAQMNSYFNSVSSIASAATSILGSETAAGKAIAVAAATIDTYRAAVSAMATTPGGFVAKAIALTATIATGIATVKNILSTKVPGASDTTSAASIPTPMNVTTPNIQSYYTPEVTQATQELTSAENQSINSRVYIVESDIEDALDTSKVQVDQSDFQL